MTFETDLQYNIKVMVIWAIFIVVMAIFSYLNDVGINTFIFNQRLEFLGISYPPTVASVFLMLCSLGILGRILYMMKKGPREKLEKRLKELEKQVTEKSLAEGEKKA